MASLDLDWALFRPYRETGEIFEMAAFATLNAGLFAGWFMDKKGMHSFDPSKGKVRLIDRGDHFEYISAGIDNILPRMGPKFGLASNLQAGVRLKW